MEMVEYLTWIMDDQSQSYSDSKAAKNIDFVHSLGLKCDCVGWCVLDLTRPDIEDIFNKIGDFAAKEGFHLRGIYTRQFHNFESDWYTLNEKYLSNGEWNYVDVKGDDENIYTLKEVYGYKIPKFTTALWQNPLPAVTEQFREACLKNNLSGIDFYWKRDIGKYKAVQFFDLIIENMVPFCACDRYLDYSERYKNRQRDHSPGTRLHFDYLALGGHLPRLAGMFYDLGVHLPIWLPKKNMPDTEFAFFYVYEGDYICKHVLIRKNAAKTLLAEGAIKSFDIEPVQLFDEKPEGYYIQNSNAVSYPPLEIRKKLEEDYDAFIKEPKLERKATDKMALRILRQIKKINPTDFNKAIPKKRTQTLIGTPYEAIIPYYLICDGGMLSDEITFLKMDESISKSSIFAEEMSKEELLQEKTEGIVIAACTDGDVIVVTTEDKVKRISHETMDIYESWDTVAQFFYDSIDYPSI